MTVYVCGYMLVTFATVLFGKAFPWRVCGRMAPADILVYGAHGPCACNPAKFRGVVLLVNGEDRAPTRFTDRTIIIGPGGIPFPYGAVVWLEMGMAQHRGPVTKHAVAYANSNCVPEREAMAAALARVVPVHAFGKCDGRGTAQRVGADSKHWPANTRLFRGYAFVLAAEHGVVPGYVTEKPFVAAAAGAIPIYWGSDLVRTVMNPDRLLIWGENTVPKVASLLGNSSRVRDLDAVNEAWINRTANTIADLVRCTAQSATRCF